MRPLQCRSLVAELAIHSLRLSEVLMQLVILIYCVKLHCFSLTPFFLVDAICLCLICPAENCWLPDQLNLWLMLLTGIHPEMAGVCPCSWTADRTWLTLKPQTPKRTSPDWLMCPSMGQWSHISPDMFGPPSPFCSTNAQCFPTLFRTPNLLLSFLYRNHLFHYLSLLLRLHRSYHMLQRPQRQISDQGEKFCLKMLKTITAESYLVLSRLKHSW